MQSLKKAIIFAPFWRMAGHVGNNRVDRFVRWLAEDGYEVIMIRAGTREGERAEAWGREITVFDRLGLHPEPQPGQAVAVSTRKPNRLRRALAYWLFNPDPAVVWAKAAARHPKVREAMRGAAFILSSSPPESAHVGAWQLSRAHGVPHIMDMRDGWLDEPLKPLLLSSAVRRWQERRLESRIAQDAKLIQVTSDVWKELFDARYPKLAHKVHVLTNGYPAQMPEVGQKAIQDPKNEYVLIHAGRFTRSHTARLPELLLRPLLRNLSVQPCKGVIRLYGELSTDEVVNIESFQTSFGAIGWRIECPGRVARPKVLEEISIADGLLLLSASHAALPSKVFEYIPMSIPILAVAPLNSATWRLCESLRSVTLVPIDCESEQQSSPSSPFMFSATDVDISRRSGECVVPMDYFEQSLRAKFLDTLRKYVEH